MDHNILLQLRYFKLHLTIPTNRYSYLPKSQIFFHLSGINETPLETNSARIQRNKSASILLRRLRLAKAARKYEVLFVSIDRICASDGLSFEVCIYGEKAFKGIFGQRVRWGLDSKSISLMMETETCVVTNKGFQIRENVGIKRNRIYPKLTSILEEDEEDDDDEEKDVMHVMKGSDDSGCAKRWEGRPRWIRDERV